MLKKILAFNLLILTGFALVLFWLNSTRISDFYTRHKSIAEDKTAIVNTELKKQLGQKRRLVEIFLEDHYELISNLSRNPRNQALYSELNFKLGRFFSDYFSASIATEHGVPVIDDFDGNLGQLCIEDMKSFAIHNQHIVRIHPNANIYHYDLLVPFVVDGNKKIFFLSFDVSEIAGLLRTSQSNRHKLVIVQKDMDYLLEVLDAGARDKLVDRLDYRLTDDERSRILNSAAIDGTRWHILDLHDPELFIDYKNALLVQGIILFGVFVIIIAAMTGFLYAGEKKKIIAEKKLIKKNIDILDLNIKLRDANQKLSVLSVTDGLTGIYNRRYLDDRLAEEWEKSKRTGIKICLAIIDIDYFKQYNDIYGHQAGDECLKDVTKILSDSFRRTGDIVARYGGEEFAVLIIVDNEEFVFDKLDELKQSIEDSKIEHKGSAVSQYVTISAGVALKLADKSESVAELIQAADEALYRAKENGRNRVVRAE